MAFDERDKEILAEMSRRLVSSPVLNGGFDKLVLSVENIKKNQEDTSEKIDKMFETIYNPETGLFTRIYSLEHETKALKTTIDQSEEEDSSYKRKVENEIKDTAEPKDTTKRLKRIAGEDLQELANVISFKKNIAKIYWSMVAVIIVSIIKLIYELSKHS